MELRQAVRESGRSMSRQREIILEALRGTRAHPTAQDLYDAVRPSMPKLTLATVYRNLHVLQELGLARRIEVDGQSSRFDADTHDHAHAYCLRCGRVHDVPVSPPADLSSRAADATGYDVTHCNLVFEGFCPDCQSQTQSTP